MQTEKDQATRQAKTTSETAPEGWAKGYLIAYGADLKSDAAPRLAPLGLFHEGHHITIEDPETGEEARPAIVGRQNRETGRALVYWRDVDPATMPNEPRAALYTANSLARPATIGDNYPTHYQGCAILCPTITEFTALFTAIHSPGLEANPLAVKLHNPPAAGMQLSAYCYHEKPKAPGYNRRALAVQAGPELLAALDSHLTTIEHDQIFFEVTEHNTAAVVYARHNQIIGSRIAAIVQPDTIPAEALTISHQGRQFSFYWFGGSSSYFHIYQGKREAGLWSKSEPRDLTPEEARQSIEDQAAGDYWPNLLASD